MVSDLKSVSGSSPPPAPMRVRPSAPEEAPPKAAPNVPKKTELNFDAGKLRQNLQDAVKMLNDQMSSSKQGLGFSFDESVNRPVVTVRNTQTGEVVRQIPSEDLLHIAHKLDDLKGILYNQKV